MSIREWLETLASGSSTPGGGAAAALSGAMAAALVAMVCRFTLGRPKYALVQSDVEAVLRQVEILRSRLEKLIDSDVVAYGDVIAARKLPRDSTEAAAYRNRMLQLALATATEVPLETAKCAADVVELIAIIAEKGNRNLLSDISVALTLAVSAVKAAGANVRVNLPFLVDEFQRGTLDLALVDIVVRSEATRIAIQAQLESSTA